MIKSRLNTFWISLATLILLMSCETNEVIPNTDYDCNFAFSDSSEIHLNAKRYQAILENHRKNGLVGAVVLVKDKNGLWIGADGKADIASNVDVQPCNTYLIASISKVFTSAAIYRYVDKGMLSLEDNISRWLDQSVVDKIKNADEATVKDLLAHTSGIPDFYTLQFELDRINKVSNNWTKEDALEYAYGVSPTNKVGETYYYSNTNYLLLSMILESVSGLTFEQVYQQEVFNPLALTSAYYSEENPIPDGCVKGYVDIYNKGQYVDSEFLYGDELGIGGDGGVAINVYDLAMFFEGMLKGNLISESSLTEMRTWFDLPEGWSGEGEFGHVQNGFGIERFYTSHGLASGHTGGIDGFITIATHFEEEDMTLIVLSNSAGNEEGNTSFGNILEETLEIMFE